jgi:hypothetical protein
MKTTAEMAQLDLLKLKRRVAWEIYDGHFTQFSLFYQKKSLGFLFFGHTPPGVLLLFFSISASHPIRHRFR